MMVAAPDISIAAIEAAATAIANARAMRRGSPPISNILVVLRTTPRLARLYDEVMDDARVALAAANAVISEASP